MLERTYVPRRAIASFCSIWFYVKPCIQSKASEDGFRPRLSWMRRREKDQEFLQTLPQGRSKDRSVAQFPPRCCWRRPTRRRRSGPWRRSWCTCRPWSCTSCRSKASCILTTGRFPPIQSCPYHDRDQRAFCKKVFYQLITHCLYLNWSIWLHSSMSVWLHLSHLVLQPTWLERLRLTQAWKL